MPLGIGTFPGRASAVVLTILEHATLWVVGQGKNPRGRRFAYLGFFEMAWAWRVDPEVFY